MRWEYRITVDSNQDQLNELGAESWELVGVTTFISSVELPATHPGLVAISYPKTTRWTYLKRSLDDLEYQADIEAQRGRRG